MVPDVAVEVGIPPHPSVQPHSPGFAPPSPTGTSWNLSPVMRRTPSPWMPAERRRPQKIPIGGPSPLPHCLRVHTQLFALLHVRCKRPMRRPFLAILGGPSELHRRYHGEVQPASQPDLTQPDPSHPDLTPCGITTDVKSALLAEEAQVRVRHRGSR